MLLGRLGLFVGGALFGSAGVAVLTSDDAKKVYTQCTAAVLRGKDSVMATAATVKENCGDILADAKDVNDKRYAVKEQMSLEAAKAIVAQYENQDKE